MPAVAYVSRMEMHRDFDTQIGIDGAITRKAARGTRVTITIEIDGWEGGRPNLLFTMLPSDFVAISVASEKAPKKKRQRKERPAPSSPCLPLPAPREPSRWDYLEVE